ncbi:MAG: translocation/assembly module TamB domain-containing protein [Candidatus Omnitrophica bacterium]|nr:translocation/assembly module TamB domain-containing protein [Candidatus Omnitrophota bacterium]
MNGKNFYFLLTSAFIVIFLFSSLVYFFVFTTSGSASLIRFLFAWYVGSEDIVFEKAEGVLANKLSLHDITIRNARALPPESQIKIQRLDVAFTSAKLSALSVHIYNGRLQLAYSDTVLFYGNYVNKNFDLTVYSKRVSAREMLDLFTQRSILRTVTGIVTDITVKIRGSLFSIVVEGNFNIEKLSNTSFSIDDCPGTALLSLDNFKNNLRLDGQIELKSGRVFGRKTAVIDLNLSSIIYENNPKNPKFNIRGSAKVEKTNISGILQGTIGQPSLQLSSNPPMPEEVLLLMLATGRSWGAKDISLQEGKISGDLIKDFVDYFIFSGRGSKIAQRFGVNDISVIYNSQSGEVGVSTSIVDKAKVSYEVTLPQEEKTADTPAQKLTEELKITDTISIGAEKELKDERSKQPSNNRQEQKKEKVFLKFKKDF